MRTSRRDFVKLLTSSGIVLSVSRLALAEQAEFAARETLPGRQSWNPAASGAGRIDSVVKVTGSKLYAGDFRAADLPGWPAKTSHAMVIRATDATHIYDGLDLSRLTGAMKPAVVVTAEDLARIGTRVPEFYAGDLFCPLRRTPLYLGQPIALLIFEDFDAFDQARLALRGATVVKYGEETGPVTRPPYAAFRFTRVAGPTPDAADVYSPFKNGWVSPGVFQNGEHPVWARLPIPHRARVCGGRGLRRRYSRRACGGQSGASGAGAAIRDAIGRSDVSRAGKRSRLVRPWRQEPRTRRRRAIALRCRRIRRLPARRSRRRAQTGAHQHALRLYGRWFRRPRPYAVSALCRAGGDVLPRPPGPAREQSLRAIPIGDQAAWLLDAHADGRRSGHRQNLRFCRRPCFARWRA